MVGLWHWVYHNMITVGCLLGTYRTNSMEQQRPTPSLGADPFCSIAHRIHGAGIYANIKGVY